MSRPAPCSTAELSILNDEAHATIRIILEAAARIVAQARAAPVRRTRILSAVTRKNYPDVHHTLLRAAGILQQLAGPLGGAA